ncbi:hypothetical protein ABZ604_31595 [Streptomyces sp. NPDC012473]|uniref:hypothetical protein n=1 Tax=Streptomyces sp. NPDC012473 TaxID=3156676 RepID=UPI0033DE4322
MNAQDQQARNSTPTDEITAEEIDSLSEFGLTEDDVAEAMGPVAAKIRAMAEDTGRDVEEFFLSLDDNLFGTLCVGYLAAKRAGHTNEKLAREAELNTLAALSRIGREDLGPLAQALSRS